nr:hypothetical protein [Tanacetum cinerariifolium]
MVYQNFLKEFWSTAVSFNPFPLIDEPKKHPLKEFLIKFLVLNGQRPLTLDFNTFCSSTGLNYNNSKYVDHPTPEGPEDSKALSKKSNRPKSKKSPTENMVTLPKPTEGSGLLGHIHDPQNLERDIQLASTGLTSTLDEGTYKSQPLLESTATHPKDLGVNKQPLDMDITSMTPDGGTIKPTSCPEGSLGDKDSGGSIPPADMEPIHTPVVDISWTGNKYQDELEKESDKEEELAIEDDMDEDSQDDAEVRTPSPNQTQPEPSHVQESASDSSSPNLKRFDNTLPLTERQLIKYLRKMSRASIKEYYKESIARRDQNDQLVASSMNSLDKSSSSISDLYKGLNVFTELLKDINNVVKDDPATNKKINEAIKTFAKISTQTIKILSLVKTFDFSTLQSTMQDLRLMLSNKRKCQHVYQAFKGQPSLAPSSSVTPTLALTHILENAEGENATNTATKEPPFHAEGETGDTTMATPISSIHPTEIQEYWDKHKKRKKVAEETKLLAMSRPEVIKVIREEAKKLRIDQKEAISTKHGETFKKA